MKTIDRGRIAALIYRERRQFIDNHPKSRAFSERARTHLLSGAPLPWMREWHTPFNIYAAGASGATVTDVDGHEYSDFCLGDTGAMFGHSPAAFVEMVADKLAGGITHMLPTEDSLWLGEELSRRFRLKYWSFALTATDANRFACRFAREITGRPKILVFDGCYHGTLGETLVNLKGNRVVRRSGSVGITGDPQITTRIVDFNDLDQLDRELSHGDVACVLAEPALTNCSMVLPIPGFHDGLRELTRRHNSLLIIDETHTFSSGPAGYTGAFDLEPDMLTLGKPIGGGVPAAIYGLSAEVGERAQNRLEENNNFSTGIGGTLAANASSMRAMRLMFEQVITPSSYEHMLSMAAALESGIGATIEDYQIPWHVSRLGARVEYGTNPEPWVNAREVEACRDREIEQLLHLYCLNRGVLITPFHNMLLASPATTESHVEQHNDAFNQAVRELVEGDI